LSSEKQQNVPSPALLLVQTLQQVDKIVLLLVSNCNR